MRWARGWGRGRRDRLFVFPGLAAHAGRHRGRRPRPTRGRPRAQTPGDRTPGIVSPTVSVRVSPGHREPGLRPRRQNAASVFVLPELAGGLSSPRHRHTRAARPSSEARGARIPHSHPWPGTSSRAPSPSPVLLTLRRQEPGWRATPARWDRAEPSGRGEPEALNSPPPTPPPRAGSGSEPQAEVAPPPRGLPLFPQQHRAWPGHAGAREVGGGKRGGAEKEAEGGPKAAAANAARGAGPSSPHASTGGGFGRLRGRGGRAQLGLGATRARGWRSLSLCYCRRKCAAPGNDESQTEMHVGLRSRRLTRPLHPALRQ